MYSYRICRFCSNCTSSIPDTSNSYFLLPLLYLAKILLILLIFSKNWFLFLFIFSSSGLISILLISTPIFAIYIVLSYFSLIEFSFSVLLKQKTKQVIGKLFLLFSHECIKLWMSHSALVNNSPKTWYAVCLLSFRSLFLFL